MMNALVLDRAVTSWNSKDEKRWERKTGREFKSESEDGGQQPAHSLLKDGHSSQLSKIAQTGLKYEGARREEEN
jgi:hypothetical protein